MKAAASALFGIATSLGVCIMAASIASAVMANSEQGEAPAAGVADLWTVEPIRVDTARQSYTRLPPQYSSYVNDAPKIAAATLLPNQEAAKPSSIVEPPASLVAAEHKSWCIQHYRSYDASSDSYKSFSGEIRSCRSPASASKEDVVAAHRSDSNVVPAAASWCAARYQSYRAEDNSYQPFAGPRRPCVSPRMEELKLAGN